MNASTATTEPVTGVTYASEELTVTNTSNIPAHRPRRVYKASRGGGRRTGSAS